MAVMKVPYFALKSNKQAWTRQTLRCKSMFSSSRFDYSGVGSSDGNLAECSVGKWRKDVLSILDDIAEGPQVTGFVK